MKALDAKLDAQLKTGDAELDAKFKSIDGKLDALNTKINLSLWLIGVLVTTRILGYLANLFNWGVS